MNNTWLENLKAGDDVFIKNGNIGRLMTTVDRVTKTMIITANGLRFNKVSGITKVGSGFPIFYRLEEITPEGLWKYNFLEIKKDFVKKITDFEHNAVSVISNLPQEQASVDKIKAMAFNMDEIISRFQDLFPVEKKEGK